PGWHDARWRPRAPPTARAPRRHSRSRRRPRARGRRARSRRPAPSAPRCRAERWSGPRRSAAGCPRRRDPPCRRRRNARAAPCAWRPARARRGCRARPGASRPCALARRWYRRPRRAASAHAFAFGTTALLARAGGAAAAVAIHIGHVAAGVRARTATLAGIAELVVDIGAFALALGVALGLHAFVVGGGV